MGYTEGTTETVSSYDHPNEIEEVIYGSNFNEPHFGFILVIKVAGNKTRTASQMHKK